MFYSRTVKHSGKRNSSHASCMLSKTISVHKTFFWHLGGAFRRRWPSVPNLRRHLCSKAENQSIQCVFCIDPAWKSLKTLEVQIHCLNFKEKYYD